MIAFKYLKKVGVVLLLLLLISLRSIGQNSFYETDSTIAVGIKIVNNSDAINSQWCQVKSKYTTVLLTPNQINKYGLNNGSIYISRQIHFSGLNKLVFLEQLTDGKIDLFYYAEEDTCTFFIEKDSIQFIEIPKGDKSQVTYFQNQLEEITSDFPAYSENSKLTRYNKKSLSKFVSDYNNHLNRPLPNIRFGISGMSDMSKIIVPKNQTYSYLTQINYNYENSFGGGVFLDVPILMSYFSVHFDAMFVQHIYHYSLRDYQICIDLNAKVTTIKTPLLLRYTLPTNKLRPFINAGTNLAFNIQKKGNLLQQFVMNNQIENYNLKIDPFISNVKKGVTIGAGFECKINYKHSLFFEVRYNRFIRNILSETLDNSDIQFILSIDL